MNTKKTIKSDKTLALLERMTHKKMAIGNLIWSIRECEEMTQVEFANLIGVSRQYVCDIEHGRRSVSIKTAAEIALQLGYSPLQFVRLAIQDELDKSGFHYDVELKEAA